MSVADNDSNDNGTPPADDHDKLVERARRLLGTMGMTEAELDAAATSGLLIPLASLGHQVVNALGRLDALEAYLRAKIAEERRGGRIIIPGQTN